jgi:type I restriction enzyme, S subunit
MEIVEAKLEDICIQVTDGTHDSPKLREKGIPFIKGKHISGGTIDFANSDFISYPDHKKVIARSKPEEGDILFSNIGSVGDAARVDVDFEFSIKNVALLKPDPEKINARYLYYYVISPKFQDEIASQVSGSAQPFIGLSRLRDCVIRYHSASETQHRIAAILAAYDDLIENNTRRIAILEEMAQLLYREWFVHFRFPGHEDVAMVDSEVGEIPAGWGVRKLGDVLELAYGKGLRKKDRKPGPYPVYGSSGVFDQHNEPLVDGPGIIVGRKGNVGSVYWSDKGFCPIDTVFYVITDVNLRYVYYNLQHQNFISSDTAVPGLNRNQAYSLPFLLPSADLMREFEEFVDSLFDLVRNLENQIDNLRRTRDLLLPRLISGELDVSDLEIDTAMLT